MSDGVLMPHADHAGIMHFWALATKLKQLRRQGWIDRGVNDPESTADHSWGVALLAWLLASDRTDLDRDRVLILGLVHDLPEALAGDATPFDAMRTADGTVPANLFSELPSYSTEFKREKADRERAALDEMLRGLPVDLAREIQDAWNEYESRATPEARFVREIDKLETLIQAEMYFARQPELEIGSYRLGVTRDVTDPHLVPLVESALRLNRLDDAQP
jgi:putative hydrolases of HD superfamily